MDSGISSASDVPVTGEISKEEFVIFRSVTNGTPIMIRVIRWIGAAFCSKRVVPDCGDSRQSNMSPSAYRSFRRGQNVLGME
jgi:hypothetical protein